MQHLCTLKHYLCIEIQNLKVMQEVKTVESLLKKYVAEAELKSRVHVSNSGNTYFRYRADELEILMGLLSYLCKEKVEARGNKRLSESLSEYKYFDDILSKDEVALLKSDLAKVEKAIFSSLVLLENTTGFAYSEPEEIIRLMLDISDIPEESNIYNPFSGVNSIAIVGREKRYHVVGQEVHVQEWEMGQLRLMMAGIESEVRLGDPFRESLLGTIDNIICCPPFAQKELIPAIQKWYDQLKEGGKIVLLVEPHMLSAMANRAFWNDMIAKRAVRLVAQLPENLLTYTNIAPCILVLEKKEKDSILFADFSFAHKSFAAKSKLQVLDLEAIKHTLQLPNTTEDPNDNIVKIVPYSAYRESLGVNPLYYMVDRAEGTPLLDVAAIIRDYEKVPEDKPFHIVQPADLSATYPLEAVAPHIEERSYRATRYVRIPDNAVLVATNSKGILIGYTEKLGDTPVYAPHTIQVLCPKDISVSHLMLLLKQPIVEKQFMYANKGTRGVILSINREVLSNIVLPMIPSDTVEEMVDKAKLAAMSEGERKLLDEFTQYKKRVSMNKHAASQNLSSLDAILKSLKTCLERNGWQIEGDKRLNAVSDFTVKSAVEFLVEQMAIVSNQIKSLNAPEKKAEKLADIDPQNFTDEYFAANPPLRFIVRNEMDNHYKERLELDIPNEETGKLEKAYIEEGTPIHYIHFPMEALMQIYQNIVSNAVTYGFTDPKREDYCIVFNMRMDGSSAIVEISNNGTPLGEDVDPMDILLDGFSSKLNEDGHEGHGGAEVAELMKKYKGTAEVISDPKDEFSLTYRLTFTDTNVVNLGDIW